MDGFNAVDWKAVVRKMHSFPNQFTNESKGEANANIGDLLGEVEDPTVNDSVSNATKDTEDTIDAKNKINHKTRHSITFIALCQRNLPPPSLT